MDSRGDDWLYSARRRRRRKVWLISAGRSRMIESSMYVCRKRLKVASFKYILSSKEVKKTEKCDRKSHIESCPYARTSARTVSNPFRTHFPTHIARAEVRFYAHVRRNPTSGLDSGRPSWTHERILGPVIWFDVVSENWKVGFPGTFGPLRSSISHDNRDLQKSMNWSYIDIKGKWTISSDISVQAGMY